MRTVSVQTTSATTATMDVKELRKKALAALIAARGPIGKCTHKDHQVKSLESSTRPRIALTQYIAPCVYLGEAVRNQSCGCGSKLRSCEIHGQCTTQQVKPPLACCMTCQDYKTIDDIDDVRRHLIYYVFPVVGSSWQWNVERIRSYLPLFNGRRSIAVGTNSPNPRYQLESVDRVREVIGTDCDIITAPQKRKLGEVTAFRALLSQVRNYRGPKDFTFYAHAKGVTKGHLGQPGTPIGIWTDLMYRANLEHWDDVAKDLETHCITGAFRRDGPFLGPYHYSGTFFWFRNKDVFTRNWSKVKQTYGGVEMWPGGMFDKSEAGCIFYESTNRPLMYDAIEATRAQRCYGSWPWPDCDGVSRHSECRAIMDEALKIQVEDTLVKEGDGIVMLAGGKHDIDSYVSISMIRQTGCTLPIKLYETGEVSKLVRNLPGVEVRKLPDIKFPTDRWWEFKEVAINDSGFRRVMYLDADAYPVVDPTLYISDCSRFGATFWWDVPVSERVFHMEVFGTDDSNHWHMKTPQGGVMFIDTVLCARPLAILRYLHQYSNLLYNCSFSDQELMRAIWCRLQLPYSCCTYDSVKDLVGELRVFLHEGPDNTPFVVHRTQAKFSWPDKAQVRDDSIPGEEAAWRFYKEYKSLTSQ